MAMLSSHIKTISFAKLQGAGNDFIVIKDLSLEFPWQERELIQRCCHRQLGIGADGLILVQPSSLADYRMRIFNQDGVEATMCGNGLRCVALYLSDENKTSFKIETAQGVHECSIEGSRVTIELGTPLIQGWDLPLACGYAGHVINTGVPHAVVFVEELQIADFVSIGRQIRFQDSFAPHGVNVNFACLYTNGEIGVRTYERGVEGETLACGTGAAAVAVAASLLYDVPSPVTLTCQSQEKLIGYVHKSRGKISNFFLQGPAKHVFNGKVDLYTL